MILRGNFSSTFSEPSWFQPWISTATIRQAKGRWDSGTDFCVVFVIKKIGGVEKVGPL